MNVAVIGAGHGGCATAAHLSRMGQKVRLYDKFNSVIEPLRVARAISLRGVIGEGVYPLELASDRIEEALAGAEVVIVVTPAFAHGELARAMLPYLEDGQIVLLHPGRTGGAMEFVRVLGDSRFKKRIYVAEAQTLLYACRKSSPVEVKVLGLKRAVKVAALPASDGDYVTGVLVPMFPQFVGARNVLETSLMNIGAMFHPAPTLLNLGRIENTHGDFHYYHDGITPAVARVVETVDRERMSVAQALGVATVPAAQWLADSYGVGGGSLYEMIQNNSAYSEVKAPGDIGARYLTEDVPTGLVPLSSFGRIAGVETPVIDSLIQIASAMHGRDYRAVGRNERALGISGLKADAVLKLVERGPCSA